MEKSSAQNKVYFPGLQGLRAVAVIAIVLYHSRANTFPNGFLGVDLFFVVSGYLVIPKMVVAVRDGQLPQFYLKRLMRLGPSFATMLCVTLPLILAFGSWRSHEQYLAQAFLSIFLLGNIGAYLISGDYFSPDSFMPLVHTWSLAVEEQFYLLAPLLIKVLRPKLYALLLFSSFLTWSFPLIFETKSANIIFYMLFPRIWEFGIGGFIFQIQRKLNSESSRIRALNFAHNNFRIILLAILATLVIPVRIPTVISTLTIVLLTSLAILVIEKVSSINVFLTWIGNRSYSIYLYHMPLLYLAKFTYLFYSQDRSLQTICALFLTLIFAHYSYEMVEKRYRQTKLNHA